MNCSDLYFIGRSMVYKFASYKMGVARGYPKPLTHVFQHCMPYPAALYGLPPDYDKMYGNISNSLIPLKLRTISMLVLLYLYKLRNFVI